MAEYIEREVGAELVEKLRYYANTYTIGDNLGREIEGTDELLFEAAEVIEKLIAADVAPVVRGRWVTNAYGQTMCSHCELPIPGYWGMYEDCPDGVWTEIGHTPCCPNCGARMEE